MNNLVYIKKQLKDNMLYLRRDFNVDKIGVFGSVVKGKETSTSDVDLLVGFSNTPSLFNFLRLEDKLRQILKRDVDLVTKKAIKPAVRNTILSEVVYV